MNSLDAFDEAARDLISEDIEAGGLSFTRFVTTKGGKVWKFRADYCGTEAEMDDKAERSTGKRIKRP
jgi:hypothetical protein